MGLKKHIVSIDDDESILSLTEAILSEDFQVTTFHDAERALTSLTSIFPDLILCDINMPGLDGYEVHQAIREIASLQGVPFIYVTGLSDRKHFRKGMNRGADDYLTKPFSPAELKETVMARLQRAQNLRQEDLEIISLGGVVVTAGGKILEYEAKKVIELLLYMLSKHNRVIWRELFAELWWEVVNDNAVHVLVGRARKTFAGLAEFVIEGEIMDLVLHRPYYWDAHTFETEAKQSLETSDFVAIEKSIQLYKGAFLKDFDSPWSNAQRDYYEGLYVQLLEASIQLAPNESAQQIAKQRLESFYSD